MCTIFGMLIPLLGTYPREITGWTRTSLQRVVSVTVKGRFYESMCGNLLCFLNKRRHTEEESGDGEMLLVAGGRLQCKSPGGALPGRHACGVITKVRRGEIHTWASRQIHARSLVDVQNIPGDGPKANSARRLCWRGGVDQAGGVGWLLTFLPSEGWTPWTQHCSRH